MTTLAPAQAPVPDGGPMGHVWITFEIANGDDLARGQAVRSLVVREALMDTGATLLALPPALIAELGLRADGSVPVETATGRVELRVFRNALISFEDRRATVDVLELSEGCEPLFGAIPMELLGVEPNTRERNIRRFPLVHGGRSYFRA